MQLLLVVVGAIAVTAVANRRGLQPSIVVVVLASAVSFVPGLPRFELEPGLILSVVLPPLLYSAALDFSVYSLARNLRPILALGVGMVIVSTLVTGVVANWVVPELGVVAALVLGAVVAPPDAVSAVAIGRKLGLPKRLMTILTGESLVNDATALTIFTLAVAAATGSHPFIDNAVLLFLYSTVVGCGVGLALAAGVHWARQRLGESGLETVLGLVVPFAAYLFAEELHGSGVLAVVTAGFWLGHHDADAGFATRLQGRQVWRSLDTLLEAFVFAYMGLQCKFVFDDLPIHGDEWGRFVLSAVVVLLTVLLIRPLWVFLTYGQRVLRRRYLTFLPRRPRRPDASQPLPRAQLLVVSWSGMRGVVTMAAAAGVPALTASGEPFPGRSIIQALAFVVAVGSLLIQVPTLPMLVRRLGISADDERATEAAATRRARHIARTAAEQALRNLLTEPPSGVDPAAMTAIRDRMAAAMRARQSADDRDAEVEEAERSPAIRQAMLTVRREMLAAQRRALTAARDAGELDDEVMRRELERLDYEEAAAAAD